MRVGVAACVVLLTLCPGCRSVVRTDPAPPTGSDAALIEGRVDYAGDPLFLPQTVRRARTPTYARIRYQHRTRYDHTSNAQFMNPLLMVGFRGIGVDVESMGELEVSDEDHVVGTYAASCTVRLRRSVWIWGAPSETELRRDALVCVRQIIEAAMLRDRPQLEEISREAAARAAGGEAVLEAEP